MFKLGVVRRFATAATAAQGFYRQFLMRVHPDFFGDDAVSRQTNERSLQTLNGLMATRKSLDAIERIQHSGKQFEANLEFDVREPSSDSASDVSTRVRRVSARFLAPISRQAEGIVTYKRRFDTAFDGLLKDLATQADMDTSAWRSNDAADSEAGKGADAATTSSEPEWIDTDIYMFKKDRDAAFVEVVERQLGRYILADWTLMSQKKEDDGLDPSLELHNYVPLLHESSVFSPLLSDAERADAFATLRANLVALNFVKWFELPIILTLPAHVRQSQPAAAAEEDRFLKEFGRGYVLIAADFADDLSGTRERIFNQLPAVRKSFADRNRGAVAIDRLLRSVANGPLRLASLSIEAPLLASVTVLRLLEAVAADPPAWLKAGDAIALAGVHLSIVEPRPNGERSFSSARFGDTLTVYGDAEAGVMSFDVRRWRLRVPTTATLADLAAFLGSESSRLVIAGLREQIDAYARRTEQFNRLLEAATLSLGFAAIAVDAGLTHETGQFLPPDLTRTDSGTLLVPYSFGPIVSEHATRQRVLSRMAFRFLQELVERDIEALVGVIRDRSDIYLVLSDRFHIDYLDERDSLFKLDRTAQTRSRVPTQQRQQLVLRVPMRDFSVDKLRAFLRRGTVE
jgi:hypothetical protein